MLSDRDGWNHLYHISAQGKVKRQITSGDFNVTSFYGIDENKRLYYQSSEMNATERNIYSIRINGRSKKLLTSEKGTHRGTFTNDFSLFVNTYSAEGYRRWSHFETTTAASFVHSKRTNALRLHWKHTLTHRKNFSQLVRQPAATSTLG